MQRLYTHQIKGDRSDEFIRYVIKIIVAYIFVSMATILTQTQLQELPPGDRILRCRLG